MLHFSCFMLCFLTSICRHFAEGQTTTPSVPHTTAATPTSRPGTGTGAKDAVNYIPGLQFQYTAKQYAGYLASVGNTKYFYWYLESQDTPTKDPIIVWLSPYPGCSSLNSLLTEIGPFRPNPDAGTLHENVFSWNKAANLLFIDSPAGVGFSPAGKGTVSDDEVANSNFQALYDFFYTKFPTLQTKDLYIAGQGYGAVYAMTLAKKVADATATKKFPNILKGVIIGNGAVHQKYQFNAMINLIYYHGLIGNDVWDQLRASCACLDEPSDHCGFYGAYNSTGATDCKKSVASLLQLVSTNMSLDMSNIYQDCYSSIGKRSFMSSVTFLDSPGYFPPTSARSPDPASEAKTAPRAAYDIAHEIDYDSTDSLLGFSCWADISKYLSEKSVMQELHVDRSIKTFTNCKSLAYIQTYYDLDAVITDLLKKNTIRILLYNGDLDLENNFLGLEWYIDHHLSLIPDLKLKMVEKRNPFTYRGQTAGFVKRYTNLDYVIVKGAGRAVAMDRGGPALQILVNFLKHSNSYSTATTINTTPNNGDAAKVNWFMVVWGFISLFICSVL